MRKLPALVLLLGAACSPLQAPLILSAPNEPLPYKTTTPSATPAPTGLLAFAQTPLPSPTPFSYVIKSGDTLGGIADHFSVSLDALLAANPDISPNAMSVGETIKVPSTRREISGQGTPTPAAFAVQQIDCRPTGDHQLWCFVLAYNDSPDVLEDVTAQISLLDANGQTTATQAATLPLNILPAHQALPLAALFADASGDLRPQVHVLTAVRLPPNDPRYLPAALQNTQVRVDGSGLSAQAEGQVLLPADARPAASVWVAAVAYDRDGRVVGLRRWESNAGLQPGAALPFSMFISSVGGEIERVDFAVEARP